MCLDCWHVWFYIKISVWFMFSFKVKLYILISIIWIHKVGIWEKILTMQYDTEVYRMRTMYGNTLSVCYVCLLSLSILFMNQKFSLFGNLCFLYYFWFEKPFKCFPYTCSSWSGEVTDKSISTDIKWWQGQLHFILLLVLMWESIAQSDIWKLTACMPLILMFVMVFVSRIGIRD